MSKKGSKKAELAEKMDKIEGFQDQRFAGEGGGSRYGILPCLMLRYGAEAWGMRARI